MRTQELCVCVNVCFHLAAGAADSPTLAGGAVGDLAVAELSGQTGVTGLSDEEKKDKKNVKEKKRRRWSVSDPGPRVA